MKFSPRLLLKPRYGSILLMNPPTSTGDLGLTKKMPVVMGIEKPSKSHLEDLKVDHHSPSRSGDLHLLQTQASLLPQQTVVTEVE
ncbi:hypothetical protein F442_22587 [Phytophthora nicotianae P10297]|uniref:Uncharacterized protein n=2 Tax=Phytophthora nicotianae TaxID=4792 RepID=W2XZI1_PHYNI|nr:hypothetical protein F444_22365 [Phytophthora nicotianae P1976]ETP28126.1 hypothetical protein F442_22587 [Phytophthora nicotianae P10297]